jgi:hypothetical protein
MGKKDAYWWVAYLDAYGFSQTVTEASSNRTAVAPTSGRSKVTACHPLEAVHLQLQGAIDEARQRLGSEYPATAMLAVSDCIFLVAPIKTSTTATATSSMLAAINSTRVVLTALDLYGFTMRGGVACGSGVFFDKATGTLLGAPVLRAVAYEKELAPPLVWLPEIEMRVVDMQVPGGLAKDLFPNAPTIAETRDGGLLATRVILPGDDKSFRRLLDQRYQKYIVNGPASVARSYRDALSIVEDLLGEPHER